MTIGERIKALRANKEMSQLELAKIVGVTDRAVSTWENETRVPRMVQH